MKPVEYRPDDVLIECGLEALMQSPGSIEATRFLTLPRGRRMESVQRHRQWQATLDQKKFFDQVFGADTAAAGD
jgi:hypothetical protein